MMVLMVVPEGIPGWVICLDDVGEMVLTWRMVMVEMVAFRRLGLKRRWLRVFLL